MTIAKFNEIMKTVSDFGNAMAEYGWTDNKMAHSLYEDICSELVKMVTWEK